MNIVQQLQDTENVTFRLGQVVVQGMYTQKDILDTVEKSPTVSTRQSACTAILSRSTVWRSTLSHSSSTCRYKTIIFIKCVFVSG